MKVRRATVDDVGAVARLGALAWDESFYQGMGIGYSTENAAEQCRVALHSGIVQVAEVDDEVVGYVVVALAHGAARGSHYVHPDYREAVGTRLLKQAENVARQLKYPFLSITELSTDLNPAVEDAGFARTEVVYTKEL